MQVNLNDRQLEAVKHKSGPLLIIAGAGTGKTAVITQRIIHLINEELARPSEILALTFTEKAAFEMVERVDMSMPMGYEEPWISTFHSFCDRILRQEGSYIGLDTNYTLMSTAQSYILFRKNLFEMPLNKFRPMGNPTSAIGDILTHFSRLQDEATLQDEYIEFAKSMREDDIPEKFTKEEFIELANVYKAYTDIKVANSKLDFGDLIIFTIKLFKEKPNILEKYRKRFKYILVDEYQDTNFTQNQLVNMLALGDKPEEATKESRKKVNLTVVGDDDQSIYKFRGAAISNILQFKETYPSAKKVVLTENYRSRQEILDASYQLISHNNPYRLEVTEDIQKRLVSKIDGKPNPTAVQLIATQTGGQEAEAVAKEILRLTGNKDRLKDDAVVDKRFDDRGQSMFVDVAPESKVYRFSDIALLVRANSHADEFIQSLKYYGIPFKHSGPKGLYSRAEVSVLISFLKSVVDKNDSISQFNILKMPVWSLNPREVMEIMGYSRKAKMPVIEWLEREFNLVVGKLPDNLTLAEISCTPLIDNLLSEEAKQSVVTLLSIYDKAYKSLQSGGGIGSILYDFFLSSGYMASLLGQDDLQTQFKVQNISKFFELIKAYEKDNPDSNIFEYVDFLQYSIDIGDNPKVDQDLLDDYNAVNISTIHSSKGLEYPVVFMLNLVKERFPSSNRSDKIAIPEGLVKETPTALTPEESHIQEERRLAYVGVTRAKERLYLTAATLYSEGGRKKNPSIFLDEILDRKISADEFSSTATNGESAFPNFGHLDDSDLAEFDNLTPTGVKPGQFVSYSQLDTYGSCPKKYKYQYILNLTSPESHTFAYGTTIHSTLKKFYEAHNLIDTLFTEAKDPSLDNLLSLYESSWVGVGYESKKHEATRKEFGRESLTRYFSEMYNPTDRVLGLEVGFKLKLDNTTINGRIDRIDLVSEVDGKKVVNLIDYKTGKFNEKDKKDVLQLAIYAIAAEQLLGLVVNRVSFWFVEHGKKVEYEVDDKIRIEGRRIIDERVSQMQRGLFQAKPDLFGCRFCAYKEICTDAMI